MSRFTIYQDNYADTTIVSNLFIDEYMKDANDAQIKIYLYLLRMMSAHKATSVSDIADKFNHTEKDVMRALKYWEKNNLLAADPFAKPSYSLDELKEFKNNEETSQIIFVAEQYIGRPLTAPEMKTILFFSDRLHFSVDLIDYLIQYCVEKGKRDFRYIEKVAISWAQEGISTPAQAARYAAKYDKNVYDIMKALGKSSIPTKAEADYAMKWVREYGFTEAGSQNRSQERTVQPVHAH